MMSPMWLLSPTCASATVSSSSHSNNPKCLTLPAGPSRGTDGGGPGRYPAGRRSCTGCPGVGVEGVGPRGDPMIRRRIKGRRNQERPDHREVPLGLARAGTPRVADHQRPRVSTEVPGVHLGRRGDHDSGGDVEPEQSRSRRVAALVVPSLGEVHVLGVGDARTASLNLVSAAHAFGFSRATSRDRQADDLVASGGVKDDQVSPVLGRAVDPVRQRSGTPGPDARADLLGYLLRGAPRR